jgi:CRP/FNR family transcriptional regulator, cyclic AMP receptor protein
VSSSLLTEVPLFAGLSEQDQAVIAQNLDEVRVAASQRVFNRGDPGGALFIVAEGEVELFVEDTTGERTVLETACPGSYFGELSLLDGQPRSAHAVATLDARLLRVDRTDLTKLFQVHPAAAIELLSVMGRRLRETDRLLDSRPSRTPNEEAEEHVTGLQRVADGLAEFSGSIPFLLIHLGWFMIWVSINLGFVPWLDPFDRYPFGLLTMVVSLEAIFLSCFVLISQNRQAAKDRIRSDVEYEANIRASLEVTQLHAKVDRLYEQSMARLHALEKAAGTTAPPAPGSAASPRPPGGTYGAAP